MSEDLHGIHVLHVDDDPRFGQMTATLLEQTYSQFTVTNLADPSEVTSLLDSCQFDCIVSDYQMPGMDGLELLEAIRDRGVELPFVLYIGKGSEEIASEAISRGVTDYVQKDSHSDTHLVLGNRIQNAVSRHRAKERYRKIFEQTADGILVLDPESAEILEVNDRYCEMSGYSSDELVGNSIELVSANTPDKDRDGVKDAIQRMSEDKPQQLDWYKKAVVQNCSHSVMVGLATSFPRW